MSETGEMELPKKLFFCVDDIKRSPFLFPYDDQSPQDFQLIFSMKIISVFITVKYFSIPHNGIAEERKKLVAINWENHEELPRKSQARDVPRKQDYITQASERTEGRVKRRSRVGQLLQNILRIEWNCRPAWFK